MMKQTENKTPHIAYLGEYGFPEGFAAIQRQLLVSMGLVENDCKVTVVSFKGVHHRRVNFPPEGQLKGVRYCYTSGSIYRPKSFWGRNKQKISGRIHELGLLRKWKRQQNLDACIVSTRSFGLLALYWFWLKLFGVPMYLSAVELGSSIQARRASRMTRLNDYMYERLGYRLPTGIMPISDLLLQLCRERAPKVPVLKTPIICDFDEFDLDIEEGEEIQLVYCGSPSYFEVIGFILQAFDQLKLFEKPVYLDLILGGGDQAALDRIHEAIAQMVHRDRVRLHRNISREEVARLYKKATALIIPLRPTLQDEARFPHKLGEYLASGNAVITSAIGEINQYPFIDKENALVAGSYDVDQFSAQMQYAIDYPSRARAIGAAGRAMGLMYFDYYKIGRDIKQFMFSTNQKQEKALHPLAVEKQTQL